MMKDVHVEAEEALVSFDVTSLFTNVPIDEAVDVIHRKLTEEDLVERTRYQQRITELLQLCLKSTYLSYNGESYGKGGRSVVAFAIPLFVSMQHHTTFGVYNTCILQACIEPHPRAPQTHLPILRTYANIEIGSYLPCV